MTSPPDRRAHRTRVRFASLRERLAARLWPAPVAAVLAAVLLGLALPVLDAVVDEHLPPWLADTLFSGGSDAARAVLSAIAGSLVAATTLTFSLTVVALQLASSQASPRVLRMFTRDRVVHRTLAIFLGTFAFALTVLRSVHDATDLDSGAVPRIAVTLAFLLTLASILTLVFFLAHLARQLRIETVLRDVHDETSGTIMLLADAEQSGDAEPLERPARARVVRATTSGFLTSSDRDRLLGLGVERDVVIEEARAIGGNVVEGTPLAFWWPADPQRVPEDDAVAEIERSIGAAFGIAYERTPTQDLGFGLRQLADIAVRAVSPGVNDPTTAVHAIGHISAVLGDIARLPEQSATLRDDAGTARVVVCTHEFADLVEIGIGQTRRYGAGDPDVVARLYGLLREVGYVVRREADRDVVASQRARLDATVATTSYDDVERARFAEQSVAVGAALEGRWT